MSLKKDHLVKPFENFWLLNTDTTPLIRKHSPTLENRGYVYVPNNKVKNNAPVDVGYDISVVGLSARRPLYGVGEPPWNLPLSMRLFDSQDHINTATARQVNELLNNQDLPFGEELTLNCLDSKYCAPEYIAGTYGQANLVNIIRLSSNRNVWEKLGEQEQQDNRLDYKNNKGPNKVYGDIAYRLNESENWENKPDEEIRFGVKLKNGKHCIVEIQLYTDMLIRTKRGISMKDKPFNLVSIRLLDEQGQTPVLKKRLWLGVWGKRKNEISLEEIYWAYRNRYDIEHFFRFGKQRLLLNKLQTPDKEHIANWLEIVSMAYWLLWVGKEESNPKVKEWQKYDQNYQNRVKFDLPASPSEVQRQLESIILGFEQTPFLPKPQINGRPRQKGEVQPKRQTYKVIIKGKTG